MRAMVKSRPLAPYEIRWRSPLHGRVTLRVKCRAHNCTGERDVYEWSWAGHGIAKCCGCGGWWRLGDPSAKTAGVSPNWHAAPGVTP